MVKVGFAAFYLIYAETLNWVVPDFHLDVCDFLEDYGTLGLLMMPRGHGKSTILDIYNAWKLYINPDHLILHQGATDPDAYKVSRGTQQVLERHPLCVLFGVKKERGETQKWWVSGSTDVRHGSIHARGILSNVTGSRANEIQNDDVEVPSNIGTPEAREKLRYRLSEQTHILIPGGQELYVGTPHTHDSLYSDIMKNPDSKCLIFKMFKDEKRFFNIIEFKVNFKPASIFSGIYRGSRILIEDTDYTVKKIGKFYHIFLNKEHALVDVYSEALWPDRFTLKEMQKRRRKCKTLNEWDSQYQLHAKPVTEVRLDPDNILAYDCEPVLRRANGQYYMMLGGRKIVGASLRWDPSSGKKKSDVSSTALVFHDDIGTKYWHRSIALTGKVVETADDGSPIGGQVWQLCDIIEQYHLTRITLETNGIGGFAPESLKAALKKRRIRCGVTEVHSSKAKNLRILEGIEGPLISGLIWAHISVLEKDGEDSEQVKQMREFNPAITDQPDDYLDSLSGAITSEPERIGKIHNEQEANESPNWKESSGVHEATLDFEY